MSALQPGRFTPEQRAELRAAVDQSRREGLVELERLRQVRVQRESTRPKKSPVIRAAEMAQRAQDAVVIAREVVAERPVDGLRCCLCGAPAVCGFCVAHNDLRTQSNGPAPTSHEAAGTRPSTQEGRP